MGNLQLPNTTNGGKDLSITNYWDNNFNELSVKKHAATSLRKLIAACFRLFLKIRFITGLELTCEVELDVFKVLLRHL